MNATNAKALNSMKQKVRKAIKEYEQDIAKYQAVRAFICILRRIFELCSRTQKVSNAITQLW